MSSLKAWLEARRPRPPEDLWQRLVAGLDDRDDRAGGDAVAGPEGAEASRRVRALRRAAVRHLETAAGRPGRVREAAFDLLVADALVTYACEAALEAVEPVRALDDLVEVGRGR